MIILLFYSDCISNQVAFIYVLSSFYVTEF